MKKLLLSLSMAALLPATGFADSFDVTFGGKQETENDWPNISAYDKTITSSSEFGGTKWTISNFNNNTNKWEYIKGGGKNTTTDCSISNESALSYKINKVSITVDAIANGNVNSVTLLVADNNAFTDATSYSFTGDKATKGTWEIPVGEPSADKFYKVNFNVTNTTAKTNGVIQISKFTFSYATEEGFVEAPSMSPAAG